jgi:hypothetical protein
VLLVFFTPKDVGLVPLLGRLASLSDEMAPRGLSVVALCLSEDLNGAFDAARLAGPRVLDTLPLVTDWGRPAGSPGGGSDAAHPSSAAARALDVRTTPLALLVNAAGKESARGLALDEPNWPDLKLRLQGVVK